jgi:hypothetical protein
MGLPICVNLGQQLLSPTRRLQEELQSFFLMTSFRNNADEQHRMDNIHIDGAQKVHRRNVKLHLTLGEILPKLRLVLPESDRCLVVM